MKKRRGEHQRVDYHSRASGGQSPTVRLWLCSSLLVAGAVAWLLSIGESSVITSVLFLMAVALAAGTGARAILSGPAAAPRRLQVNLTIGSAAVMLLLLEMMLRYGLGTHVTYPERNGSRNYRSIYAYDNPTWFHLYRPHESVRWVRREFTHERRVNSLGLADDEYSPAKRQDEFRVIALGDSFTEGVGASHDKTGSRRSSDTCHACLMAGLYTR